MGPFLRVLSSLSYEPTQQILYRTESKFRAGYSKFLGVGDFQINSVAQSTESKTVTQIYVNTVQWVKIYIVLAFL